MGETIDFVAGGAGQIPDVSLPVESGIASVRGGGQPLSQSERSFFEPRFGSDFSGVRLHTDGQAAGLTQTVQAKAFTIANDIFFGNGQYEPGTAKGRRLLAHELTHVIQQDRNNLIENATVLRKTYGDEEYSFEMRKDGRIIVKTDDWLSKYSAALYDGDMTHTDEFVRLKKNYATLIENMDLNDLENEVVLIENKDLITEGEDIYHIKTLIIYLSGKKPAAPNLFEIPEELKTPPPRPPGHIDPNLPPPYEGPQIFGGPKTETEGQRYQRELKEKEQRRGGSSDRPGTQKGEIDILKVRKYLKQYL